MNEEQNSQNEYETYYEPYYESNYEANYEESSKSNDGKRANILCAISLACEIVPTIVSGLALSAMYRIMDESTSSFSDIITNIIGTVDFILMVAGLILMIYVRIKYPKNVFGKVLMWLYIAAAVIMVLIVILYMVIAFVACISCISCMQDLG